jgi:hypothetical protein
MTRIERLESTPKPPSASNKPFLHYPPVPAFTLLFHLVDKSGLGPACGRGVRDAFGNPPGHKRVMR